MVITAADPGALGDTIEISFSKFQKPAKVGDNVTFDVTVTEEISYKNVTPAAVTKILGSTADAEPKGGLVFVSSAAVPSLPKKANDPYQLVGDPGKASIDATVGTAFELTAKKGGPDSSLIEVTISDLTATDFTLTSRWIKTEKSMTVVTLKTNPFSYRINIDPPVNGGELGVPAEGVVKLFGGVDAQAATPASAVVMAG
jgi:hypothetical protein